MQVIDHMPAAWFLFGDGTDYILDVNSGRGGVGFSLTTTLSEEECREYRLRGRDYIHELAERIADEADPGNPRFIRHKETADAIHQAVMEWKGTRQS